MPAKGADVCTTRAHDCHVRLGRGAGIQADLKAFAAAGTYGHVRARRAHGAEHAGVAAIHELPPEFVIAQLDAVFGDIGVDAAKTGMLFSRVLIETVAAYLAGIRCRLSSTR